MLVTLRKKKRDFQNLYAFHLYLPKYLEISLESDSVSVLHLSKASFFEKFYVKFAYLEQEQNYHTKSSYLVCPDVFCHSYSAVEVNVMIHIDKIASHKKLL